MNAPMKDDDAKFESFLREFAPRRPQPLPFTQSGWRLWPRLAAAAALILALGAGIAWMFSRPIENRHGSPNTATSIPAAETPHPRMSTLTLTREALEGSPEFNAEMDARARHSLPRFDRQDSMLRVLAKD